MKEENVRITPEEVIDRYADMVYRLALLQVKNRTDADDIFQEVFVRLVKHIHKLQDWEHVKAWLIRVTTNCSKKHFTRYWNKNVSLLEDAESIREEAWVEDAGYEAAENGEILFRAVKKLPEKYRVAIHLFYFEELSVAQIAAATGQKESTVKSQLHRAREMLKTLLEGEIIL